MAETETTPVVVENQPATPGASRSLYDQPDTIDLMGSGDDTFGKAARENDSNGQIDREDVATSGNTIAEQLAALNKPKAEESKPDVSTTETSAEDKNGAARRVEPAKVEPIVPAAAATPDQPKEQPVVVPAEQIKAEADKLITEQLGGKTIEEAKKALADPASLLDENEQRLLNLYRNGGDFVAYQQLQSKNFDTMAPLDVLKEQYVRDHPGLTPATAERAFQREVANKYPGLANEDPEDSDYQIDTELLGLAANQARASLKETQTSARILPKEEAANSDESANAAKAQAEQQAKIALYEEHLKKVATLIPTVAGRSLEWTDEESNAVYKLTVGGYDSLLFNKTTFESGMKDPGGFINDLITGEDRKTIDYGKLSQVMQILANHDQDLKLSYKAGRDAAEAERILKAKNPEPLHTLGSPTQGDSLDHKRAAFRAANQPQNGEKSLMDS